jgi:hypothetical protein
VGDGRAVSLISDLRLLSGQEAGRPYTGAPDQLDSRNALLGGVFYLLDWTRQAALDIPGLPGTPSLEQERWIATMVDGPRSSGRKKRSALYRFSPTNRRAGGEG